MMSGRVLADVAPAGNGSTGPVNAALVDKLLSEAQTALRSGNIRLALITSKNAVAAAPHNGSARAKLGMVLLLSGDAPTAERELRQAMTDGAPRLTVLPTLFDAMLNRNETQTLLDQFPDPGTAPKDPAAADILKARALALQSLKRLPEARDSMDRSLTLRRDASGLLSRARLAQLQGNYLDAGRFADEAIAKSSDPSAMLFKLGLLLFGHDNGAALELANQLLTKYPGNLPGRFARIEAYLGLKQDAKAKEEVEDIVAKYPAAPLGTYYKALLLARAGDSKGGWNIAQNLPEEFQDNQPAMAVKISQMAIASGNLDTGAAILNRILRKYPGVIAARAQLAHVRLWQNNPSDALVALQPVRESRDPQILQLLSDIYLRLQRNNEALETLKKLDAVTKDRANVKRTIALLELQTGRSDEGMRDISRFVAGHPTDLIAAGPFITALTQSRRFAEALAVADRLGSDPKTGSAGLAYRGAILNLQHDNAGALDAFNKAVKTDPKDINALYARAEFLVTQQRLAEASRDLRAILALNAKNMPALMKLAEIAAAQGAEQDVESILGRAIAAAPQNAAPRLTLVRYLLLRNKFKEAMTSDKDLLRVQPNSVDGLVLLGRVQLALGQKKDAIQTYRRLTVMMPTDPGAQVLLGNALSETRDFSGAMRALETATKLSPNSVDIAAARIRALTGQGDSVAAVAAARSFRSSNPGTAADLLLADTLERAAKHDEAVSVLQKSLSDKPNAVVLSRLVRLAIQANDTKRAADLMSKWLAGNPADKAVRSDYAALLMQQGNSARATAEYQRILKDDPNNVVALNNLGWLLEASDPKKALAMLVLAQKLAPNSADVADTLGWVKVQQRDVAGGLALLNHAHQVQPQDANITFHLVQALDANGQRDAARSLLKTLLATGAKFTDQPAAARLAAAWH